MATLIALRYVGDGAYRPSIPARDLDADDLATTAAAQKRTIEALADEAIGSGLYRPIYDVEPEPIVEELQARAWDGLTKKELVALAAKRGVEVDPKAKNEDIRAALAAAEAPEPTPATPEPVDD